MLTHPQFVPVPPKNIQNIILYTGVHEMGLREMLGKPDKMLDGNLQWTTSHSGQE